MKTILSFIIITLLIGGSIFLFLQKPAPQRYVDLIVEADPLEIKNDPTRILFVGDIMLDRGIRRTIDKNGFDYILKDISEIFYDKDLIIGNLEGTITENESVSVINNQILHFTFATSTASDLKRIGFDVFSLANNHTLDFYQAGFDETNRNLSEAGVFSFGHPLNNQNLSYETVKKGLNLCLVGYHSLYNSSTTNVLNEIKKIKPNCDYLAVFAHWGIEYEDYENDNQREQAHSFIDSGADLVIGAHPHVLEPIEIYKNKAIFYSLGNFIFDQDFSLKTKRGIAVEVEINENNQIFHIIPLEISKGKLSYLGGDNFLSGLNLIISKLPNGPKEDLMTNLSFSLSN